MLDFVVFERRRGTEEGIADAFAREEEGGGEEELEWMAAVPNVCGEARRTRTWLSAKVKMREQNWRRTSDDTEASDAESSWFDDAGDVAILTLKALSLRRVGPSLQNCASEACCSQPPNELTNLTNFATSDTVYYV